MEVKHTPAPWRATKREVPEGLNWASRIPFAIERPAGGAVLPVADVCDQPEAEANARLIAAAPELLDALRACAAVCAGETMHKQGLIDTLQLAQKAITKATGSGS